MVMMVANVAARWVVRTLISDLVADLSLGDLVNAIAERAPVVDLPSRMSVEEVADVVDTMVKREVDWSPKR